MKLSNILIVLTTLLLAAFNKQNDQLSVQPNSSRQEAAVTMMCPNPAQISDSLALVALYNATGGGAWTVNWNLNTPVCTPWPGVELDAEGYVISIILSGNDLINNLPADIGDFSRLRTLQLDNNNLSGNIPFQIGNLTELDILFLDDNDFTGTVPPTMGFLDKLTVLYLDNNDLGGAIPQTFQGLTFLQKLDIFNNNFDSLPDLSVINIQPNRFRIFNNNFTFDDILPNNPAALGSNYAPQDSVFQAMSVTLNTGDVYTIDLGFDSGVLDNSYQWYKDGVPFGAPLNVNQLTFDPVTWNTPGVYTCEITNLNFPDLTLHSRSVTISVNCGVSINNIEPILCQGESITINGTVYDEDNPSGSETLNGLDQYGCDSLINVNLDFYPENVYTLTDTLCNGESIVVNGTTYDQDNPGGLEFIPEPDINGCDSMVAVNLSFYTNPASGNLLQEICSGDSIVINGTTYNENNTSGLEMIPGGNINGCDSTFFVEISFYPVANGVYNPVICEGESIEYQGVTYNNGNTSGLAELGPVAEHGCDSTVTVNLSFFPPAEGFITETLCNEGSIVVNGTVYNQANPSGTEVLGGASYQGCDSTIYIDLSFDSSISELIDPTLCPGESIIVNGELYDENNPSGSELMPNGSYIGCDSTAIVDLSFYPPAESNLTPTLCDGESLEVNGTTYNQANPSGTVILFGLSANGCDSTVFVNLSFYSPAEASLTPTLCEDESINVNGTTYNFDNPTGTEVLSGASVTGCDSTVFVNLSFYADAVSNFNPTLCPDESVSINGTIYNQTNPGGTEILANASINGCDSTVFVNLSFYPESTSLVNPTLCNGDAITVNGVIYNENNPSGTEVVSNGSANGCDSTITVDLSFYAENVYSYEPVLCQGGSIEVNGTTYNEDNPNGTEVFPNAGPNGCDSIVQVALDFLPGPSFDFNPELCFGESVTVNGTVYDELNPTGTEILPNGASNGCDSIINVALNFMDNEAGNVFQTLCHGESLEFNGNIYNDDNPSGLEFLENASYNGCDSLIFIELSFYDPVEFNLNPTLCTTEERIVNGTVYNFSSPSGTETLTGAAQNGCDSTVFVNLSFYQESSMLLNPTLCQGEEITVNGTIYNETAPSGTEVLPGASVNGCDSTIMVELSFYPEFTYDFDPVLCEGESIEINGTLYDESNPSGTETFVNGGPNGCDSTVFIQLDFYPQAMNEIVTTLCHNESLTINGNLYNETNPTGMETLQGASYTGCDSLIQIELSFYTAAASNLSESICAGESFILGNESFNSSGSFAVVFENASSEGCDSTVYLELSVITAEMTGLADAGADLSVCETESELQGNLPPGTSGRWTTTSEAIILNADQATTAIENLQPGNNIFLWTLSTSLCPDYHSNAVNIYLEEAPQAVNDVFNLIYNSTQNELKVLENDEPGADGDWMLEILSDPGQGLLEETEPGIFNFQTPTNFTGELSFSYQLCHTLCPELCSEASVRIQIEEPEFDQSDIPNGITPNGDGINEEFVIPHLEFDPERFPDRELIVFNRWGDIVYQARPYLNDWNGSTQSGQELPQGTYYYVLRLNIAEGVILKGDVTILK